MKIALFYYDGFSEFEIALVALFFRRYDLVATALQDREYRSEECQRFCVDMPLRDLDPASIDLLVIPGGEPAHLLGSDELKRFIGELLAGDKKVAGICGGASLLAGFGFLEGKRCTGMSSGVRPVHPSFQYYAGALPCDEPVVVDGSLITAQGQAYVEFALELVRQMGLYANEEEYREDLRWFKNIR